MALGDMEHPGHHYVFRLYALSSASLDVPQISPAPLAVRAIRAQAIATAEVILTYRRLSLAHRGQPN
ncbi:MAG TPA: hypothetical protein VFQ88_12445 [Nevskiaceae bacterium]|nr:hypothetical protein [Nevskiaceae bacterium]